MTLSIDGLLVLTSGVATITAYTPPIPLTLEFSVLSGDTISLNLESESGQLPNCIIDWGDGQTTTVSSAGTYSNIYASSGTKTINILGKLPKFAVNSASASNLSRVINFGNGGLINLQSAFNGATNLTSVPQILPSTVTNINGMFFYCSNFNDSAVTNWDTSNVTVMGALFAGATIFNQPIGNWNVGNVTLMGSMFNEALAFNQDISAWNTAKVTSMQYMFSGAVSFNQPLNTWNTSSVTDMQSMFEKAIAFNQPLNNWDVSNVTTMYGMFASGVGAMTFNQNISNWNVSKVTNMQTMFYNTPFNNGGDPGINNWNVSSVTTMYSMFALCQFNQPISNWNTSSVTEMGRMFYINSQFNQNISGWNTSSVTNMDEMFNNAISFNQNLSSWVTTGLSTCPPVNFATNSPLGSNPQNLPVFYCVQAAPIANFYGTPTSGVQPLSVSFTDTSANYPTSWAWDFTNDGITDSTERNPTHIYSSAGTYTVKLTASNSYGTNTVTKTNYINVQSPAQPFELVYTVNTGDTVTLPLYGTVNCTVDWGDGSTNSYTTTGNKTHTYASGGAKTVTISGTLTEYGTASVSHPKLTSVTAFGDTGLTKLRFAFSGAANLSSVPNTLPTTVTDISGLFWDCTNFNSSAVTNWNTANVTLMQGMFTQARAFNQPIGSWNTASVTNMAEMFTFAVAFNQNVSNWNVGSVISMSNMFEAASAFNNGGSADINNWNITSVLDMSYMFSYAISFNQPLNLWNTSGVQLMNYMFENASAFNQDISSWATQGLTSCPPVFFARNSPLATQPAKLPTFICAAPVADFTATPTSGTTPLSVAFTDTSTNTPSSWAWDFTNDGSTDSTAQNPTNIYNSSGTFTVKMTATNARGSNTVTKTNLITVTAAPPPPTAEFTLVYNVTGSPLRITLPLYGTGESYDQGINCTVDWGDGSSQVVNTAGNVQHTYSSSGTKTVTITGTLPVYEAGFQSTDKGKLTSVTSFGNVGLTKVRFSGEENLTSVPNSLPTTVTNLSYAFGYCSSFDSSAVTSWNTVNITDMSGMFAQATAFNQDIGNWNTAAVTSMTNMFYGATAFNQNIGSWNTQNVTDMSYMFSQATAFNQNIGSWNTANVTNMFSMFAQATAFNQDIGSWNTSAATDMGSMFNESFAFNQDIGSWNTAAVTNMNSMFALATSFNQNIGSWNTQNVTDMSYMFYSASTFNQNLTGWCVTNIASEPFWFSLYSALTSENKPVWGTCPASPTSPDLIATINTAAPDATNTISIFLGYDNVNCTIDWGDGNVSVYSVIGNADHTYTTSGTYTITISGTLDRISFANQNALISVNSWGNLSFTDLGSCFSGCSNLISVPNNIPSTVTSLFGMFFNAYNFDQDIGGWDVSAVTDMSQMFRGSAFNNGNSNSINSWNTSLVTNMSSMFSQAPFNQPIGNWNVSSVVYMNNLFSFNFVFNQNISGWDVSNVTDMSSMFNYAGQFNQNLTGWCVQNIPSLPDDFATGSALDSANYPVWGTCP